MANEATAIFDSVLAQPKPRLSDSMPSATEPDLDPQRTASNLERVLNLLSIPNNAVAGGAQALIEGTDPLQGALAGIDQHTTFGKILKSQGLSGPVAGTLGLGLDILLDPTTYLGVGEFTKAGQVARQATLGLKLAGLEGKVSDIAHWTQQVARTGELGPSLRAQAKAGQRAALSLGGQAIVPRGFSEAVLGSLEDVAGRFGNSDMGQSLSRMFQSASRRAPEELRAFYGATKGGAAAEAMGNIKTMLEPHARELELLTRKANVPYKVGATILADAIQKGEFPGDIVKAIEQGKATFGATRLETKPLLRMANSINLANSYAIASEKKAGLPISHLVGVQQYLKRMITPEGLAAYRKVHPGVGGIGPREFSTEFGAQIMRDPALRDLTISEVNQLGQVGKIPGLEGIIVKEFFHEDPFVATAHRLTESAQAVGSKQFLEGAMRLYGSSKGAAPADWVPVTETLMRQLAVPKGTVFPRAVADLLDSHYEKMVTPQYLQGFFKAFDKLQGAWKSITLPIWPSYHVRNLISDGWMISAVPGGIPIQRLVQRGVQGAKAVMGLNGEVRLGNRYWSYKELKNLGEQSGVLLMGAGPGLEEYGRESMLSLAKDPLSMLQNNRFMRAAVTVGTGRENFTRMTYFIERLARGDHPLQAALETKLRLFDYGELSDFEKQVMRRIFPFYSWARNNIPFQIGHMMRRPGYGAAFQKVREEIGTAFGAEGPSQGAGPLPQFLARGVPVPVGQTSEGLPRFLRTQNIIPIGDVSQVTSPAALGQMLVDQLSPFPKAVGEAAANYDLFKNRPLERFPGESQSYLGVPVRGRLAPFLDLLRPVAELNRLNPGNIFGSSGQPSAFGAARSTPDQSGAERLANYLVARTYSVDPAQQAYQEQAALKGVVSQLEYARLLALSKGDTFNAQAAERQIENLMQHPEQALGLRR